MSKPQIDLFPPGEFIRDEIAARDWTQEDLAEILGRPLRTVNQIIAGKKAVTPQTAQELAAAFGTTPELWLNLENAYRLAQDRQEPEAVTRRARLYELAPVKDMVKRRWIPDAKTASELESAVTKFFEITSLDQSPSLACAARKATSYNVTTTAQLAWFFRVKHLASVLRVGPFDADKVIGLLPKLHALTVSESMVHKVPAILAEMGIRFVVVEQLPRSRVDGAALWLDKNAPVIALSLRYDRIDGFWHTLAHELAHVLHGGGGVDVDLVGAHRTDIDEKPEAEREADEFASNFLIDRAKLNSFILRHKPRFSKVSISQFASRHQIHPGIVVGQLQFRKAIQYCHNREMLVPVRDNLASTALTDGWGYFVSF